MSQPHMQSAKVIPIIAEVVADWQGRSVSKPRNTLPLAISGGMFRMLRRSACRSAGLQECGCISQGQFNLPTRANPCESCNKPGVSSLEFSEALFGKAFEKQQYVGPVVCDRTIQRWLNGKSPATPAHVATALGRAWRYGWISGNVAYSLVKDLGLWESVLAAVRSARKKLSSTDKGSVIEVETLRQSLSISEADIERQRAADENRFLQAFRRDAYGFSAPNLLHGAR